MDKSKRIQGAKELGQSNDKKAVEWLLKLFKASHSIIRQKTPEKAKIQQEISRLDLTIKKNADGSPVTNSQGQPLANNQNDTRKYQQELLPASQKVEREIRDEEEIKNAVVSALSGMTNEDAVNEMLKKVKKGADYEQVGLAEALGMVLDPRVPEALGEALAKSKDDMVRIALIDALSTKSATAQAGAIAAAMEKSDSWQVKSAAAKALAQMNAKDQIPAIIEELKGADGRLKDDLNNALVKMTGVNKHGDYNVWNAWWKDNSGNVLADGFAPVESGGGEAGGGQTTFYGIPVVSKRLAFILDRSGSMAEPAGWKPEDVVGTGGGPGEAPDANIGDRKIDVARYELERAIMGLPEDAQFTVIVYNHEYQMWSEKGLKKANAKNKKAAIAWFKGFEPEGATNVYDPTERAFNLAGIGMDDKNYDVSVDTIFLLSDGLPNNGQITDPGEIRAKIKDMNKLRKIVINTIGVFISAGGQPAGAGGAGAAPPPAADQVKQGEELMKGIADENNGTFVKR
jgi:HEAT repeat protein